MSASLHALSSGSDSHLARPSTHQVYTQATALRRVVTRVYDTVLAGFEELHRAEAEFEASVLGLLVDPEPNEPRGTPRQGLSIDHLAALPKIRCTAHLECAACPICCAQATTTIKFFFA